MLYDDPVELVVRAFAESVSDLYFIQIGSNDGEQLDPLRYSILHYHWRGIMVEPVPYVFERLVRNYGSVPGVALENVAIADRDGSMPFYHLRQAAPGEKLPRLYDALGSFRREVVLKHEHLIPGIRDRVITTQVATLRFDSLVRKHAVEKIDLLHVDTEGYDFEVLKTVDFERWSIPMLIYESEHLSASDQSACQAFLAERGYESFSDARDTVALRTSEKAAISERVLKAFRSQSQRFAK
jgi:FkbM family methyltransferase